MMHYRFIWLPGEMSWNTRKSKIHIAWQISRSGIYIECWCARKYCILVVSIPGVFISAHCVRNTTVSENSGRTSHRFCSVWSNAIPISKIRNETRKDAVFPCLLPGIYILERLRFTLSLRGKIKLFGDIKSKWVHLQTCCCLMVPIAGQCSAGAENSLLS